MNNRAIKQKNKQVIFLIGGSLLVVLVTGIILQQKNTQRGNIPTTIPMLSETPKTATLQLEQQGNNTIHVVVNAGTRNITGVQLVLSYDPRILSDVRIKRGTYFVNPFELLNIIDKTKGTITYTIGISPKGTSQGGKGIVAQITYRAKQGEASETRIDFLAQTKVTAEGIDASVLQNPSGISLNL